MADLPAGFVLDQQPASRNAQLPPGFQLDGPEAPAPLPVEAQRTPASESGRRFIGPAEGALQLATGAIAEPIAVLGGLQSVMAGEPDPKAVMNQLRQQYTYAPRTPEGQAALPNLVNAVSNAIPQPVKDVASAIGQQYQRVNNAVGERFGPTAASQMDVAASALGQAAGMRGINRTSAIARAEIPAAARQTLEAGQRLNVPVLTSDVLPPETFFGRFAQGLSEKMGPLGSGPARAVQQAQRQAALQGLADEFEVDLDTDFAGQIVRSINEKSAKVLKEAGEQRNQAVNSLVRFGALPLTETNRTIREQLARQARLGDKADTALITNLQKIQSSLSQAENPADFALVKDLRTEVISDLRALNNSDDPRAAAAIQAVKSAMDRDMTQFARTHDMNAARDWVRSNRAFANEYTNIKDTELRRAFNKGDVTPEVVMPILRGGKVSELRRLERSLTPSGRAAARAAIIQDALKDSGFFSTAENAVNPDRFATAMNRANRTQAMNIFFGEADEKQLEGFVRLMNATRRAQQATAAPPTGVQTVPLIAGSGAGAALYAEPLTAVLTLGTLSAFAKAYESAPVRNLLLRLGSSRAGSPLESQLLELAVPAANGALQAARTRQQQQSEQQPAIP